LAAGFGSFGGIADRLDQQDVALFGQLQGAPELLLCGQAQQAGAEPLFEGY
jgi:hypothetical protein